MTTLYKRAEFNLVQPVKRQRVAYPVAEEIFIWETGRAIIKGFGHNNVRRYI